jgi:hypothetical protein
VSQSEVVPALVRRRVEKLRERAARDAVFAAEVGPWLGLPLSAWADDGEGAVEGYVGQRWCRIRLDEVLLGNASWPGSKRIPI